MPRRNRLAIPDLPHQIVQRSRANLTRRVAASFSILAGIVPSVE
jgi:hypothetical protein